MDRPERRGTDAAPALEGGGAGQADRSVRAGAPPLRRDRIALAVATLGVGIPAVHRDRRGAAAADPLATGPRVLPGRSPGVPAAPRGHARPRAATPHRASQGADPAATAAL